MAAPEVDASQRAQHYARRANLEIAVAVLRARRDEILDRWLDAAARQPFHQGRREHAVADHIPTLYDAIVDALAGLAEGRAMEPPQEYPAVVDAARQHAGARTQQGLQPREVVIEFRLLRQEISRAFCDALPESIPLDDVLAAQLLLNDTIDSAMMVGLESLVLAVETLKDEFLLTLTHDLRNPLTSLKGTAQLLARYLDASPPDIERVRRGLEQIDAQASRLADLTAEMLDVSRIRLGRFEIVRAPTTFDAVLTRVLERQEPRVRARLRVQRGPESGRTGVWDAGRLEAVLENLLSNAVKFSPAGTPIRITVTGDERELRVSVADEGRGADPSELSRLFECFYRAPEVAEAETEGTGIGLYVARGIIEAHGGRIWATSPGRGHGCTVHFTLPWDVPRPPEAPEGRGVTNRG
ncbi:MAG: sensor histidine kinase [Chloroflexi bacterium]|nr:sensor histidine kinase [Chloroflexota bacterium]